ncbi:uncharacterized protein HaLaN_01240 [Haematococcus lacustris]|uniref:Uncharacterized protein n=1 Tax=Haematococcus lacustris TaxID=44745 RepID=A0A699YHU6_HAELA|nr:uncharacterized protein HaLaN_01240 [Haematococcus lacustris]
MAGLAKPAPDSPAPHPALDCEPPQMAEAVFAKVDTAVIQRIAKIMSYIKTTAGDKKIRKKERDELLGELIKAGAPGGPGGTVPSAAGGQRPATATVKVEEQEEDIFGEAGTDYKPSVAAKPKPSVAATAYNAEDMDLEEGEMTAHGAAWAAGQGGSGGPLLGPTPPPAAGGDQGYSDPYTVQQQQAYSLGGQQGVQLWQGQPGQEGHALWSERDGYGQQDAAMGYGQQAEGPKWRVRAKKTEERMVDYVDDAYGEFYQLAGGSEVPTLEDDDDIPDPKAALKAAKGDARTAGRGDKEGAREDKAKVNTQLQKIETLLKDKGHDHSGAFGRTPSRKISTGDDPSITPAHGKKRRI